MLNKIWCFFILIAIIFGILSGNYLNVNDAIFSSIEDTVQLIITMFGSLCFWNGLFRKR